MNLLFDIRCQAAPHLKKWRRVEAPTSMDAAAMIEEWADSREFFETPRDVEVRQVGERTVITLSVEGYWTLLARAKV